MEDVVIDDAPVSTNGQAPVEAAPEQKPLKDYTNDELVALHRQLLSTRRRLNNDFNIIYGVLIGRGLDVEPED
jgi:hypothetical protein